MRKHFVAHLDVMQCIVGGGEVCEFPEHGEVADVIHVVLVDVQNAQGCLPGRPFHSTLQSAGTQGIHRANTGPDH